MADQRTKAEIEADKKTGARAGGSIAGFQQVTGVMYRGVIYCGSFAAGFTDPYGNKLDGPVDEDDEPLTEWPKTLKDTKRKRRPIVAADVDEDDDDDDDDDDELDEDDDEVDTVERMRRDFASGSPTTKPGASGSGVSLAEATGQPNASEVSKDGTPNMTDAHGNKPADAGLPARMSPRGEDTPLQSTGAGRRNAQTPAQRRAAEKDKQRGKGGSK